MIVKPLVLVGDQHPVEQRIHLIGRQRHAPQAILHSIGAQQRAMMVAEMMTDFCMKKCFDAKWRSGKVEPCVSGCVRKMVEMQGIVVKEMRDRQTKLNKIRERRGGRRR